MRSPSARADEPEAGTRMAARELAVAGAEAFDKQDFVTALDRFQRAAQGVISVATRPSCARRRTGWRA